MTNQSIDSLKVSLISQISALSNEDMLRQLEQILMPRESANPSDLLYRLARPMPQKLDIDALIIKQNFKGVNRSKFNQLVRKINIQEPLEQLLAAV
ncbi:MAG: hypothetical protein ACKVT2_01465 [Saprospiraceae bacterium]